MSSWRPSAPPPQGGWHPPEPHPAAPTSTPAGPSSPAGGQAPWSAHPRDSSGHDDPEGMQSILQRSRDQARFVAPVVEPERPPRRLPWRSVITVFTVVGLIAVILGVLTATIWRPQAVDPATIVKPSEGTSERALLTPQDAVRTYLEALAAGDIEAALATGTIGGDETSSHLLLAPEVQVKMRERAPITDIRILTAETDVTQVEVSYKLAGTPVNTTIPVQLGESGSYELTRTTVTVLVELGQADALPLFVAGVEVPKFKPLEVVPGVYELTTGLPLVEYPKENTIEITSLRYAEQTPFAATPRLSAEGREAFLDAVRSSLDDCAASHAIAPPGCPQGRRPAKPIAQDSVRWRIDGNPLVEQQPELSTKDRTLASLQLDLRFDLTFRYADGSNPGKDRVEVTTRATANMMGKSAEDITVVWAR